MTKPAFVLILNSSHCPFSALSDPLPFCRGETFIYIYIYEGELVLCLIFNIGHSIIVYCFEFCKERTVVFCASLDICKEKRCFILGDLYICCKCCKTVDLRKKKLFTV